MELNGYQVIIKNGEELDGGYVLLGHNTKYSISLINDNATDCDAEITIDGNEIGVYRVRALNSIMLERPSSQNGCFTFYKLDSREGVQASLKKGQDLGLISVIFKPERIREKGQNNYQPGGSGAYQRPGKSVSAGGTGLSGESSQRFKSVEKLDYDKNKTSTINIRLICDESEIIRPLSSKNTEIPPSLFDTFQDASKFAKKEGKGIVTRSGNGKGFIWRP